MTDTSRLLELANAIQDQVTAIHKHLAATEQEDPTFDSQVPETDYEGIDDTRALAIENLTRLHDLLSTSREILQNKAVTDFISRHALDRLGFYDAIPVGETRTYAQISEVTKQPANTIRRIVRHAMTQHIFHEPQPNVVAHTHASRLLTENHAVRDYYGTVCEEVWPAATRAADALEKWPNPTEKDQSGYVLMRGHTIHQEITENPVKHKRYDNAMAAFTTDARVGLRHVIDGYDWSSLGKATIVDVGGGIGTVSKALAKAFPQLSFIVEDQGDVIARASIDESETQNRIRFIEHDFFTPQPVKDADVYFIRRVFMEWSDDRGVLILKNLLPAMKKGSRVLIQDFHVPDPGTCMLWQERRFRASDMLTFALNSAGHRELEDWEELFKKAGSGFQFQGVKPVPNSDVVFIEAVRTDEK